MKKRKLSVSRDVEKKLYGLLERLENVVLEEEYQKVITAGAGCGDYCRFTCSYYCEYTCKESCYMTNKGGTGNACAYKSVCPNEPYMA